MTSIVELLEKLAIATPSAFDNFPRLREAVAQTQHEPAAEAPAVDDNNNNTVDCPGERCIVFFDTETPYGRGKHKDKPILEIACIVCILDELSRIKIVLPQRTFAIKVASGTTTEAEAVGNFFDFITRCTPTGRVLCAHNAKSFDSHVLFGAARRSNVEVPPDIVFCDSLSISRRYLPDAVSHSMDALSALTATKITDRHTAIGDCCALARIMEHITLHNEPWVKNVFTERAESTAQVRGRVFKESD